MIGTDIKKALALLQEGNVVGIPTETVYGLAANAFNKKAVAQIFTIKNRPSFDPLILHTDSLSTIRTFVHSIPHEAEMLANTFMPGPLTLLLQKKDTIPDIVTSGLPQVAVRIPSHPMTLALLAALPFPIAAPSANPFGYISPTTAQHVEDQLGNKLPYILDGGNCKIGVESTILGFENGKPIIYRKGGLAIEEIESIIGRVIIKEHSSSNPKSPGMLKSHYSPGCPLILGHIPSLLQKYKGQSIGVISFQQYYDEIGDEWQITLSSKGDSEEAAHRLFSGMRHLDKMQPEIILAELLPEKGLGRAINDRLRRAASKV